MSDKKKVKKVAKDDTKKSKSSKADKKSSKEKSSSAKGKKDLTPLEKARLAKAKGGTGSKKAAKKKNQPPIYKAPEDFKPHFLLVLVKTDKDGLLSNGIKATRYVGRYDPDAEDKKKIDLGSYDQKTLQGILSRLSMTTFVTNATKRLPANQVFQILLRVNRKSKDGSLSIVFKSIEVPKKSAKSGRIKWVALDKKDPDYRKFRKSSRILPAAFKAVLMPPKRVRGAKVAKEDDDE